MRLFFNFYVSREGLPAMITIKSFSGNILYRGTVFRSRFCIFLRSCEKNLVISVTPLSYGFYPEYRYLRLLEFSCRNFFFSFSFRERTAPFLQTLYLYDENYLLPVKNATLFFNRNYTV